MKNYKIAVIPGDGTGPEVARIKTLQAAAQSINSNARSRKFDLVGAPFKDQRSSARIGDRQFKKFDAMFLSDWPSDVKPDSEKGILLRLRFDLDQYIITAVNCSRTFLPAQK